jgi:low affinity Fe/Cu permease
MDKLFAKFANATARVTGSPQAFLVCVLVVLAWAVSGPIFKFSETWQLVINTGTTIITFLMVFLIQNTQNRDSKAIHLKLDELLRAHETARSGMIDLEHLSDEELKQIQAQFARLREEADDVLEEAEDLVEERQQDRVPASGRR